MLIALLLLHGVVGLGVFAAGRRLGRWSFAVAAAPPLAVLAWLATQLGTLIDGGVVTEQVEWVPSLGIEVALRLDAFGAVMVLAISGIGVAVLAYSWHYFGPARDDLHHIAGLLTIFAGAMLTVVGADDLITLFTGWELTSITSYLLIGVEHTRSPARAAALHALLVTSAGGLIMLGGIVLIAEAAGTYQMSEILADPPGGTTVAAALVCVCIGAFTKSAQYPFHSWLPGAMAAPTPISAYLHSATMVKAGVYLLGRFAPVFALTGVWRPLVLGVGVFTMVVGGVRALRQYDLKALLAYGTVSQLGFLAVLFGAGTGAATQAAITVLVAHVLYKAALFMVVGVIDHQTGTRDVRLIPPLGAGWGATKAVGVLSAISMAGVPLLAGFVAKESAYDAFDETGFSRRGLVLAGIVAGSVLTCAYSLRFIWGVVVLPGRLRAGTEQVTVRHPDQRPPGVAIGTADPPAWGFAAPGVALALLSVLFGVVPGLESSLISAATLALDPSADPHPLELWHGFNQALGLTALTFAAGGLVFAARRRLAPLLRLGERIPSGTAIYLGLLQGLNRLANRVTSIVQNGTLSIYAGVVLATAAVLPGVVLWRRAAWPDWPDVVGRPAQIPISVVLVGGALMAAIVRRRFTAVLFLSTVGYGMAALFVVQGAPDLALTQTAIETLSTVLFVLVLRRLPDRFERRSSPVTRSVRVVVSVAVGLLVFAFAIVARDARTAEPVSTAMIERALPEADGRNVVNVILVDFRGFDTMGEVAVLVAAAIGCVALARAGRSPSLRSPATQAAAGHSLQANVADGSVAGASSLASASGGTAIPGANE